MMSSHIVGVDYLLAGLVSLVYAQKRGPATAPPGRLEMLCYMVLVQSSS
jgi:hypothetical protein